MIKAAIFDLDGLLIDSEPLWQKAEIKVFNSIGVPLTKAVVAQTIGLRTDATVHYWHQRYAWTGPSEENVCKQIDDMVIALIEREGTSKEGVEEIIAICERLDVLLAIASSSSLPIINAAITKLKLDDKLKVVHSAESEVSGKPDPAVYLHTAEKLGVKPSDCLAFEDSESGVLSAKAASMFCIAVPVPEQYDNKEYRIADIVVTSLLDVTAAMIQGL